MKSFPKSDEVGITDQDNELKERIKEIAINAMELVG